MLWVYGWLRESEEVEWFAERLAMRWPFALSHSLGRRVKKEASVKSNDTDHVQGA